MSELSALTSELSVPVEAIGNPNAEELLRARSVDGGLSLTLNPLAFADPGVWGILLVDVARHISRALASEGRGSVSENMLLILNMFEKELSKPTNPGATARVSSN